MLEEYQEKVRKDYNRRLALLRYITSPTFEKFWKDCDLWDQLTAARYIRSYNLVRLREYLEKYYKKTRELGELSLSQLKDIGRDQRIEGWPRMTKAQLIREIRRNG